MYVLAVFSEAAFRNDVASVGFAQHLVELAAEVVDWLLKSAVVQIAIPRFHGHAFRHVPGVGVITVRTSEGIDVAANFLK